MQRELAALGVAVDDLRPFAAGLEFTAFRAVLDGRSVVVKTLEPVHRQRQRCRAGRARSVAAGIGDAAVRTVRRRSRARGRSPACRRRGRSARHRVRSARRIASRRPRAGPRSWRTLHSAAPPALPLVAQPGPIAEVVAERVMRRARVVEQLAGVRLALPPPSKLEAMIGSADSSRSLLHLDVRRREPADGRRTDRGAH